MLSVLAVILAMLGILTLVPGEIRAEYRTATRCTL